MPLLPGPRKPIELVLPPKYGLARRAVFKALRHFVDPRGESEVHIDVEVILYDEAGAALLTGNFAPAPYTLSAKNDTLVDADANGQILCVFGSWQSEEERQAVIASYPQNTMLQGDYFDYVRDNAAIVIKDLILLHLTQAAEQGRFA